MQGILRGDTVVLVCANAFTMEMINKGEILALVSRKAGAILGRPVRAIVEDKTAKSSSNPAMERLMDFGRNHRDIVNIKE